MARWREAALTSLIATNHPEEAEAVIIGSWLASVSRD